MPSVALDSVTPIRATPAASTAVQTRKNARRYFSVLDVSGTGDSKSAAFLAPVLHELKDKLAGQLTVCAVDVEKYEELWERFDLKGVPTLIVFKDGQEVKRIQGTRSLDELLGDLASVLT